MPGLHWYDSDALGAVLLLGGLSMRLVVLDLETALKEQVDLRGVVGLVVGVVELVGVVGHGK
jgi:hypothetical protein